MILNSLISRWGFPASLLFLIVALGVTFPNTAYQIFIVGRVVSVLAWAFLAVVFIPAILNTPQIVGNNSKPGVPNPKKWHFDANSGEYFRITGHHMGGVIFDPTPYSERCLEDYRLSKERNSAYIAICISGVAFLLSLKWTINSIEFTPYGQLVGKIEYVFEGFAVLGSGLSVLFGLIRSLFFKTIDLGPPPVAQRGLEDVEQQMAYGNARPADLSAIHDVLAGNAPTASSSVTGPRRPLYDE